MLCDRRLTYHNASTLCSTHFRRIGTHDATLLVLAVHTMNYVVADGRSNWMEGLILICMSLSFRVGSVFPVRLMADDHY